MSRRDDSAVLAAIQERLRWSRAERSPIVTPTRPTTHGRSFGDGARRLVEGVVNRDERARDLVRGFVEWGGGAAMVGRLNIDIEWLVDQLVPVLETVDT